MPGIYFSGIFYFKNMDNFFDNVPIHLISGRKFQCIGKKERVMFFWSHVFSIGEIYYETSLPISIFKDTLVLYNEEGYLYVVDKSQFVEVDVEKKQLRRVISSLKIHKN